MDSNTRPVALISVTVILILSVTFFIRLSDARDEIQQCEKQRDEERRQHVEFQRAFTKKLKEAGLGFTW